MTKRLGGTVSHLGRIGTGSETLIFRRSEHLRVYGVSFVWSAERQMAAQHYREMERELQE
jgi:hypothetical protein